MRIRIRTTSEKIAYSILKNKKDDLDLDDLGFITTVLRDNELDDELHTYYQAILKLIVRQLD